VLHAQDVQETVRFYEKHFSFEASKALIASPAFAPPQKPRRPPPKNTQFSLASTSA